MAAACRRAPGGARFGPSWVRYIVVKRRDVIAGLSASYAVGAVGAVGTIVGAAPSLARAAEDSASRAGSCVLTITGDEGPFYFDPRLVRRDVTERKPGAPVELVIRVVEVGGCAPVVGVRSDLWQADAFGLYSGYDKQTGVTEQRTHSTVGRTFLRGTQFTDADGAVAFKTIYPSWYRGRTPHIHFKVFLGGKNVVTNQIIFPEEINTQALARKPYNEHRYVRDTFNATDAYLKRDGSGVLCHIEPHRDGYRATLQVGIQKA